MHLWRSWFKILDRERCVNLKDILLNTPNSSEGVDNFGLKKLWNPYKVDK